MQSLPPIKQGDTFIIGCTYKDANKQPGDLTNVVIRSQARSAATKKLIKEFEIFKSDQVLYKGQFSISAMTNDWSIGTLNIDIEFIIDGSVISTDTFQIPVVQDITHD